MSTSPYTDQRLTQALDEVARAGGLPSLVVADDGGWLVAASTGSAQAEAVAAVAALRATGDTRRGELVSGRVKARSVPVGDAVLVVGALGDTAVCAAAFDRVQSTLEQELGAR